MPCQRCENGRWKWGRNGECRYRTRAECERDNRGREDNDDAEGDDAEGAVHTDHLWSLYGDAVPLGRVAAYLAHCADNEIADGPALDAARDGLPLRVSNGLAIVPIMGPMIRRGGALARMFGLVGTDSTRLAIESALADDDVREILLRIDSPGGSVSGLDQLADVINRADKPVIAQVEGMAASAAYYVASQADEIRVGRTDLVGSIGTRIVLYDFSERFKAEGIEPVVIDTGEFKSAGTLGTKITDSQREDFQRIVDFYFADFVEVVARGRNMTEGAVTDVADGRMFTPREAGELNLIDRVATLEETLREMRTRVRQTQRATEAARARLKL